MRSLLVAFVALVLSACSQGDSPAASRATSPVSPDDAASLTGRIRHLGLERSHDATLLPSQLLVRVGRERGEAGQRKLLAALLKKFLQGPVHRMSESLVKESFGLDLSAPGLLHGIAAGEGAAYETLAKRLLHEGGLLRHPERLDRFPTFDLAQIPRLQAAVFASAARGPEQAVGLPYKQVAPAVEIVLRDRGCRREKRPREPFLEEFHLYRGMEPMRALTVECYAENSRLLAKQLNQASNEIAGQKISGSLGREGSIVSAPVVGLRSWLEAVGQAGFTVELSTLRTPVDFLGVSLDTGGARTSLRVATWFRIPLPDGRTVRLPAEHGEIDLTLVRRGVRYAGLRWYFGIPETDHPGMAAYWRPHLFLQAPWARLMNERVEVFAPDRAAQALPWLQATAHLMQGFSTLTERYRLPANAYGLFVCSDSMALGLARLAELRGESERSRLTDAFPLIYAGGRINEIVTTVSGSSSVTLERRAPSDLSLLGDPAALLARARQAFRAVDDARWAPFPDFAGNELRQLREAR